jgi:hypothetical protein
MAVLALYLPPSPCWMARMDYPPEELLEALQLVYPQATEAEVTLLVYQIKEQDRCVFVCVLSVCVVCV